MALSRIKYEMFANIRYVGRLIDVLDRIRAVEEVLMVHIEKDLGPDRELVKVKIMTAKAPKAAFDDIRRISLGSIEELKDMTYHMQTLTKLSN
jgi:hypothetical protein